MNRKTDTHKQPETPHAMMKRLFAIAELIIQSDAYPPEKHNNNDLGYGVLKNGKTEATDGTQE